MILFPKKYSYTKNTSPFENGFKQFQNNVVAGKRSVIVDYKNNDLFFTKGSQYQIKATIPTCFYHTGIIKKTALCFPGFNHSNWYHIVADMGFQVFLAKLKKQIDVIVLPKFLQLSTTFVQFFELFNVEIMFVNHPRHSLAFSGVICFDKFTGRLSEAIRSGKLDEEVNQYFSFLQDCLLQSEQIKVYPEGGRKIFSTRRGNDSRVYEKVAEIEQEYESQGYQIVYFGGMSVLEQMSVMKNATHLSGFHGANLTNLLFAHQCKFVEELITRELSGDFQTIAKFKKANHSRRKLL